MVLNSFSIYKSHTFDHYSLKYAMPWIAIVELQKNTESNNASISINIESIKENKDSIEYILSKIESIQINPQGIPEEFAQRNDSIEGNKQ